jgi:hypothetical protein
MSKNSTLRALFEAIQKGDRSAALPLADHLEKLGADDLAALVREAIPRSSGRLVWAVGLAFETCHGDVGRGLLSWDDEPYERQTLALYRAIQAQRLGDVPIMTEANDLDDRRRECLARALFGRLELRGIQVNLSVWVSSDPLAGSDYPVWVSIPSLEWVNSGQDQRLEAAHSVTLKLCSILARGFPGLGEQCAVVLGLGGPRGPRGIPPFLISWAKYPDRWRLPRQQWQTPEEAEEDAEVAEKVRLAEARAARAAGIRRRGSEP